MQERMLHVPQKMKVPQLEGDPLGDTHDSDVKPQSDFTFQGHEPESKA